MHDRSHSCRLVLQATGLARRAIQRNWRAVPVDLRHYDEMGDRYHAPGDWTVEVVPLSGTPDRRDGEWLRARYHGFRVADVRSVAELEKWVCLADLERDTLAPAA